MCSIQEDPSLRRGSTRVDDLVDAAAGLAPTALVELLDGVLDHLLGADLTRLGAEEHSALVTRLVRHQNAQHAAVLDAIAAFDAADVASTSRHRTTRRWLEERTRLAPGTAAQLTRTARALRDHLPGTRQALGERAISPQHVAAITSVVTKVGAEHAGTAEPILLPLAREVEPSVVRRATAHMVSLIDPACAEQALHNAYEKRGVTLSIVGERGYLDGVLDAESTEILRAALQPLMTRSGETDCRTTPQLRADALLDLAKLALDSGSLPELGGERPHLSVVIDEAALRERVGAVTLPWTGLAVPVAVVRRWSCDAQLTPVLATLLPPPGARQGPATRTAVLLGGGWLPQDVGRASRLATTGQLKALRVRDGGCVHPGCTRTAAYCDAHHVRHWADGGSTSTDNMVLLCRHHHRTLHAGDWTLTSDPDQPGRFWVSVGGWDQPAQTSADRSPPLAMSVPATPGSIVTDR
jgi:hypothetical protein